MKKLYALLILMMPLSALALSNAEVRNEIQTFIDTQTYPQDLGDGVTSLTGVLTSTRGVVYSYTLSVNQDELLGLSNIMSSVYTTNLNNLCTNNAMSWYKMNDVQMSYVYYDESDNLVSLFSMSGLNC
ncbi:hypothetical protein N9F35_01005 [Gammaproteobacteria bacterium]|jgi:hypothetical protein|nr:hypothetical protein [Gammaproteobacteria bacterium]